MMANDLMQVVGHNVRRLRLQRGMTQRELAAASQVEFKSFQKVEGGKWPGMTLRRLSSISAALQVEPWKLLRQPPKAQSPK